MFTPFSGPKAGSQTRMSEHPKTSPTGASKHIEMLTNVNILNLLSYKRTIIMLNFKNSFLIFSVPASSQARVQECSKASPKRGMCSGI